MLSEGVVAVAAVAGLSHFELGHVIRDTDGSRGWCVGFRRTRGSSASIPFHVAGILFFFRDTVFPPSLPPSLLFFLHSSLDSIK